jgi:hypothetical protein
MPMTCAAPMRRSRCVKIRPIGPCPTTAQRRLIGGLVRDSARSTVASGCATTNAPLSGASSGTRASSQACATMYSAKPL